MFRFNHNSPITFSDPLPAKVDVVVIGGGVIGISTAWYLLKHGLSVLVCDKGRVAGEQSSRNWGWVRVTVRDADEVPLAMDSRRCWDEISSSLDDAVIALSLRLLRNPNKMWRALPPDSYLLPRQRRTR